jgi:undecaprenyl diphosphate synthase
MLQSIGIIPDGNRRYARKAGLSLEEAYCKGFDKAEEVFDWCLEVPGLRSATVYALSTENLDRCGAELQILTALYDSYFRKLTKSAKIHSNEVRVRVIGRLNQLDGLNETIDGLHSATAGYGKYDLNIAIAYGGRAEIIDAIQKAYIAGKVSMLTEESLSRYLYQPQDIDLLIRTGDSRRLSNFMTWQTIYSELYFSDKLWPEFSRDDFNAAVEFYGAAKRNFGK